jgi:hypothetical protein
MLFAIIFKDYLVSTLECVASVVTVIVLFFLGVLSCDY